MTNRMPTPPDPSICPLCRRPNRCGALSGAPDGADRCWCHRTRVPPGLLARVPEPLRGLACICPDCIADHAVAQIGADLPVITRPPPPPPASGG